jgi:diacylglycerol kinase family enzyme
VVCIVATAAFAISIVVFLARNGLYVVAGIAGLGLAVTGGWWLVTARTQHRRVLGIVTAVVGAAIVVVSLLAAGTESWASVVRLLVSLALLVIAVVTAQRAMAADLVRTSAIAVRRGSVPARPILLCNPWSGGGKVVSFGLAELAGSLGVEVIMLDHGLDLAELARDAVARGADCLGMAGGDGSQALVASIATEHGLPFVCISAGTRNHFALDLGLDRTDPRTGMSAFRDGIERQIDYATVNGRFFVNNVSLGVYATIVQQEEYREAKVETTKRLLPEMLGRTEEPFDLQFEAPDGRAVDGAFLVQVSNNPYVLAASLDASQRRRMDTGHLGVFAVSAGSGHEAAQVVTLALAGQSDKSEHAFEFECETFEVRSRSGRAFAGIDGEALELETPLSFAIHPGGLRLLVPAGNPEAAVRRGARDVHLRDIVRLAAGHQTAPAT